MIEARQQDVVAFQRLVEAYELKGAIEILAHVAEQQGKLLESSGLMLEATKWRRAANVLDDTHAKIVKLDITPE